MYVLKLVRVPRVPQVLYLVLTILNGEEFVALDQKDVRPLLTAVTEILCVQQQPFQAYLVQRQQEVTVNNATRTRFTDLLGVMSTAHRYVQQPLLAQVEQQLKMLFVVTQTVLKLVLVKYAQLQNKRLLDTITFTNFT
jgi:hypothetical protein